MEKALFLAIMFILAYLFGSFNFAILITRLVAGKDIRQIGNKNPGGMNVARSVGKGWGMLVLFLDSLKSILPMLTAKILFLQANECFEIVMLIVIGNCALFGHCYPLFYKFKGGLGVSAAWGIYVFFIPFELILSILASILLTQLLFRNKKFKWGRWGASVVIVIIPFIASITTLFLSIPILEHVSIGGHSLCFLLGIFSTSIFLFSISIKRIRENITAS